jgi:hypothetical protein
VTISRTEHPDDVLLRFALKLRGLGDQLNAAEVMEHVRLYRGEEAEPSVCCVPGSWGSGEGTVRFESSARGCAYWLGLLNIKKIQKLSPQNKEKEKKDGRMR